MGLLETLLHHYTTSVQPSSHPMRQMTIKGWNPSKVEEIQSFEKSWKIVQELLLRLLHFSTIFQNSWDGRNGTIQSFPTSLEVGTSVNASPIKHYFFGLDAVKQWHFLSFYFLFGGIFSFFLLWMMTLLSNLARVEGLFLLQILDLTCARSIFQHV